MVKGAKNEKKRKEKKELLKILIKGALYFLLNEEIVWILDSKNHDGNYMCHGKGMTKLN